MLADTAPPEARKPLAVLPVIAAGTAMAIVIVVGLVIRSTTGVTAWDLRILNAIGTTHTPVFTTISLAVDQLFSPLIAIAILAVSALLVLAVTRRVSPLIVFVLVAAVPWIASDAVKLIVRRPRPDPAALTHPLLTTPASFSFPSSHTSFAIALCLALLVLGWSTRARPALIALCVALPPLTGFTRMYLGAHYPTDVVASLVFTSAASVVVILAVRSVVARVGRHGE